MKKLGLFAVFCLMLSMLQAQTQTFYYSRNGEKIMMEQNETVWYVHFVPDAGTGDKEAVLDEIGVLAASVGQITPDIYRCDLTGKPVPAFTNAVAKAAAVASYSCEYRLPRSGTLHWIDRNLYVKVRDGSSIGQVMQAAGIPYQAADPVELLPHTFRVRIESADLFPACRLLFETGSVEYAQPSFYFLRYAKEPLPGGATQTMPGDWNLRGIESKTMGINAVNAWAVTTGNPGIKVAILDDGIMNNHPALAGSIQGGYTSPELPYYQTDGGMPYKHDMDGTRAAGIIASANNTQGNWGVAKDAAITSVRVRLGDLVPNGSNPPTYTYFSSVRAVVDGLQWAMNQGVDIVNISWEFYDISGLSSPSSGYDAIQDAFNELSSEGRGGKGIVIVTGSGNGDGEQVSAPASMEGVIAVGATTSAGYRASHPYPDPLEWGSNYGTKLDVVAPGESIATTGFSFSNGIYSPTYTSHYDRTRAAAAHVSGVAALILSVNPGLTAAQVKDIIEQTTYKAHKDEPYPYASDPDRPNGEWCAEMGYGLVNAEKAVHRARCFMNVPVVQGTVAQNATWNGPLQAVGDISIPAGVTLTITSTVMCDYDVSITVEPKGRLIVDGGTLTSSCNDKMWRGVQIAGNPADVLQKESEQGKVLLTNGAVIQNARTGTLVHAGGILTAENTQFLNCGTSVEFKPYTRMKSSANFSEMNNRSSFTNCEFTWDSGLIEEGTSVLPYIHVSLSGVGNITFTGCTFRSHASLDRNTHGIYAYNSGLAVTPIMEQFVHPPVIEKRPLFENLTYGIRYEKPAVSPVPRYIPNKSLTVTHSNFTGVVRGIFNSHAHNSTIQYNHFAVVPAPPAPKCLAGYMSGAEARSLTQSQADVFSESVFRTQLSTGITLNASTGYLVQGNTFTQLKTGNLYGIGIYVQDSGGAPNTIDNNTFYFLYRGIVSNGANQTHPRIGGLQLLCNTFSDTCRYAITINPTGIAPIQGNPENPAGNRFSHLNRPAAGNIYLDIENSLIYYYNQNIPEENPNPQGGNYISSIISLTPRNEPAKCGLRNGSGYAELFHLLESGKTRYANLQYTYNNLIDGGSTSQLLSELELSWDKSAWEIRDGLLAKSPYLSADVIIKVAEQNILPHAMLLEVCIANPDATRNGGLLDVVRYKIPDPMPEYMCDMIIASWDVKTFRTNLEASWASAALDLEYASRQLINLYTADTLSNVNRADSILYLLEKLPNIEAAYDLADIYAGMNNFALACEKMDGLLKRDLSDKERKEVGAMSDWYRFMEAYTVSVPLGDTLTPGHVKTLQNFTETETKAGERAKSMLYYHSGCTYNYHIEPLLPEDTKPKSMKSPRNLQDVLTEEYNKVSVYPNPAQTYTTILYELQPDAQNCILQISDIKGIVVLSATLNGNTGQYLWDTRDLSSGSYTYTITSNEKKLNSGKIIVTK